MHPSGEFCSEQVTSSPATTFHENVVIFPPALKKVHGGVFKKVNNLIRGDASRASNSL